jgi:hypothetical protein
VDDQPNLFQSVVGYVGLLLRLERRLLALVVSYSLAIGLFALIVPLTVQELTNTFAFAIQPVTIVTLAGVMIAALLFVGAFRALQYYAVEVLERRLFARVAIGMAQQIPQLQFLGFKPRYANHFMETVFMQRALSVLLVDLINVVVGGAVGNDDSCLLPSVFPAVQRAAPRGIQRRVSTFARRAPGHDRDVARQVRHAPLDAGDLL